MEPLTYFLAFARLAPLQCVLGGHPDTLGIPAIDLFISSDLQEPADAEEPLQRKAHSLAGRADLLRSAGAAGAAQAACRVRPARGRRDLFLRPDADQDPSRDGSVVRRHSRADPAGLLVLPAGYNPRLAVRLKARFARTLGVFAERVRFLPAMSHLDFMNVMALADVSLDTRPFGGGNTSWQAIAAGTPIVTWPGRFLRGRYTQALYRLASMEDTVVDSAEAYVAMALRLARERDFRSAVQARVAAGAGRIFADRPMSRALRDTLIRFANPRFASNIRRRSSRPARSRSVAGCSSASHAIPVGNEVPFLGHRTPGGIVERPAALEIDVAVGAQCARSGKHSLLSTQRRVEIERACADSSQTASPKSRNKSRAASR